jgi:hypothetical protein
MLKAPFPYAAGKSWIAPVVWERLGHVTNYVEPCCGSAAMLLARPRVGPIETVNDLNGYLTNAYRAIRLAPDKTAAWCDWPVVESDLHARHAWLLAQRETLTARLEGDPDYYDAKIAGWWIWGACCWIGPDWCSGTGPWQVQNGQLLHVGTAGQGIHRQLPHLGDAGQGNTPLRDYFEALAQRLRHVRITTGDWLRVLGPSVTWRNGLTGVFLDPPYPEEEHAVRYYASTANWHECWAWAQEQGAHPLMRIILCGYDTDRPIPDDWQVIHWKARGGYGSQGQGRGRTNAQREVLYCSPHCVKRDEELPLFAHVAQHAGAHQT